MYMYIYYYTTTYFYERITNEQGIRMFSVAARKTDGLAQLNYEHDRNPADGRRIGR